MFFNDYKLASVLLDYEKKYECNSSELLSCFTFENSEKRYFKQKYLEYNSRNLNPLTINKYRPVTYTYLGKDNITRVDVANFIAKTTSDDYLVFTNQDNSYKTLLMETNSKFRFCVLITDNKKDLDLNLSNVVIIYTKDKETYLKEFEKFKMS